MINALHVINTMQPGGAETLVARLCPALREEGVHASVAVMLGPGPVSASLPEQGVEVIDLSRGGRGDPRAPWKIMQAIRRTRAAIVHVHSPQASIAAHIATMLARVPIISTRHSVTDPKSQTAVYRFERLLTRRRTAGVVAVSDEMRDALLAQHLASPDRIHVHRNAVDLSRFAVSTRRPYPSDAPVLGTIGRLEPPKAHEVFLETIAALRPDMPGIRGVLVGDGSLRGALETRCKALGLDDVIDFAGACLPEDVPVWLSRFDAFLLTSRWEGLPVAMIEAAASGLPIVATDVGGVGEAIAGGEAGLLVPVDDVRALADAARALGSQPGLAAELGRRARDHAMREFDLRRLARQTADLYRSVLGQ